MGTARRQCVDIESNPKRMFDQFFGCACLWSFWSFTPGSIAVVIMIGDHWTDKITFIRRALRDFFGLSRSTFARNCAAGN
jgi:hypothetical protein